ncbi:MAG: hypothetical protein J1E64_00625 [Acetatifactor sp.]|nr:hypothetical protein [Acetatifactor sp.]
MNKKKLIMVDFWSIADENGKPIGHGGKVGNEYYKYVKEAYFVKHYVNQSMLSHIENPNAVAFSKSLVLGVSKVQRILSNFASLREVYKSEKDATIWFYVPDIYLFLFILLSRKGQRRIAVNVYEGYITSGVKHRIFKAALRKVDVVFVTNKKLLEDIPRGILVPDYAYDEDFYLRFECNEKKEQAVCLGTMNEKKKLKDAVEAFSQNGYPLYIIGQFSSKEIFKELCAIKRDNIVVENRYVDSDEYYRLLAESKYCLIPYDAQFYKNRTSGVVQECLFCDAVPISHKEILQFANVKGYGYENIRDLAKASLEVFDATEVRRSFQEERDRFYRYDVIRDKVVRALETPDIG